MARGGKRAGERRSFRTHLVLSTAFTAVALSLILCGILLVPLFAGLGSGEELTAEVKQVAERLLFLHEHLWYLALVSLIAPCVSSYFLYRRMTAPLVRFARVFSELGEGRASAPITLRATDYLTEHADALNAMLERVRERNDDLREREADLAQALAELAALPPHASALPEAVAQAVGAHKHLAERLNELRSA